MKKVVIAIFMFLISLVAFAQGNGIFWKVSGNGLSKPTYILGSHHLAPATFIDSIAGVREAIAAVDVVYGELRKDELVGSAAQQKMMAAAKAPADSTLSKVMTPADLTLVDSVFATFIGMKGITKQLEGMKPAMASTQLAVFLTLKVCPELNPTATPFDATVLNMGEQAGKPVCGLETLDDQIEMLLGLPISMQAENLVDAAKHINLSMKQTKMLTDAYLRQDLDGVLYATTAKEFDMKDYELERLIYKRNRNWMTQLDGGLMRNNSLFVVVGCGHLCGEKGLINLLRQKGYTVECAK